jgi:hypothetical protein
MSVIESIVRGVQGLPLPQQVAVARYVFSLNEAARRERREVLERTHGCLSDEDGKAFEEAMLNARRVEAHG